MLFSAVISPKFFTAVMLDFAPEFPDHFQWLEGHFPCYAITGA
jgi:hypothetical protein